MGSGDELRVLQIQRFCSGDGPGIRTTVFLQGCPLRCPWCHNPESRPFGARISVRQEDCLHCGLCRIDIPGTACRRDPARHCVGCGKCVDECPGGALTLHGRPMTVEEVIAVVERDRFYYQDSGGGMTLSGGEPTAQRGALRLLELARLRRIHTALESSGGVAPEVFAPFVGKADLYLFDLKASRERYRELIGVDAEMVENNLRMLSAAGCRIILRVPWGGGGNAEAGLPAFVDEYRLLPGVEAVEYLPYHDWGRNKASMAGLEEPEWTCFTSVPVPEQ